MKYYEIEAKCGHVGRSNYIIKKFYVCANNGREAAMKARLLPRVKHHHKDAIRSVSNISYEEYVEGLDNINNDSYFLVHSSTEQRLMCNFRDGEVKKEEEEIFHKKPTHAKNKIICSLLNKDWRMGRSYLYE